jgi:hypothetical protein
MVVLRHCPYKGMLKALEVLLLIVRIDGGAVIVEILGMKSCQN